MYVKFFCPYDFPNTVFIDCFTALSARGARWNRDSGGPLVCQGIPCGNQKHIIHDSINQNGGRESWPIRAGVFQINIRRAGKSVEGLFSLMQRC